MKKVIKETPHPKEKCLSEIRWYLLRLIDEELEVKRLTIIGLIADHLTHLED